MAGWDDGSIEDTGKDEVLIDADQGDPEESTGLFRFSPEAAEKNTRLDLYLSGKLTDLSRGYLQRLIEQGAVLVDGQERRPSFKVTPGQVIEVQIPPVAPIEVVPQDIPLDVIYSCLDLVVINKPAGMVVHPAPGHPIGTLVNALAFHYPEISIGGIGRPGIVHRLDKDTSGLIVVARSDRGHAALVRQWAAREVDKRYTTLVRGRVDAALGTIDAPIGRDEKDRMRMAVTPRGRDALTHFEVVQRFEEATLLDVTIATGRTHQVRVHLAFIGHPVAGDSVYNKSKGRFGGTGAIVKRQFLHARRLAFNLPDGAPVAFDAPLPADLQRALDSLEPVA